MSPASETPVRHLARGACPVIGLSRNDLAVVGWSSNRQLTLRPRQAPSVGQPLQEWGKLPRGSQFHPVFPGFTAPGAGQGPDGVRLWPKPAVSAVAMLLHPSLLRSPALGSNGDPDEQLAMGEFCEGLPSTLRGRI